ncbi:MAG: nicotinic acid mononucleotide adenylyltransferase, partial [Flavobacteriaceae bacterium]|nr:nicotinic acid mononucleotide adenylyltransferase [Flavobacteriaceae bacterium]
PNYTVNTLIHISENYPDFNFSLIMGEDNLKSFHKWKNYEVLLADYQIYVYPRVDKQKTTLKLLDHPHIHKIEAPIVEISSTDIRNSIKNNKNFRPLVPDNVWNYIDEMNFYKG